MRIGIYAGSFNPIHYGHLDTAKFLCERLYINCLQLMVTPCSPFKTDNTDMADAYHRYKMALAAREDYVWHSANNMIQLPNIHASNYEMLHFGDRKCAYTVDTMRRIVYEYPDDEFFLIIGMDVFENIKKFKDYEWLLYSGIIKIIVLTRPGYERVDKTEYKNCIFVTDAPKIDISSTQIREMIKNGEDVSKYTTKNVIKYIKENKLYGSI